ncbi:MAG: CPBP family intramembrane metalloprotease [bacterium]|nr:CPBP family intramembrane metalloprotease [bacterium]
MDLTKNRIKNSIIIFLICLAVHAFEVLVIRTDETVVAECFINKVFGVILLFVVLHMLNMSWRNIGFVKERFLSDCLRGFGICAVFYSIGFLIEFMILNMQNNPGHIEFFVTGFSLTGNVVKQTGIGFVVLCIFFNIINVWMEEGLFRGFYITYISEEHSKKTALFIAALLFGVWHLVTPFRSVLDGEMTIGVFVVMSIGYMILSALMGIKWGLLYEMSGTIWIGLADHFFNNCVVTNLLHVVTATGVDELQIARVLIGELTSFIFVVIYAKKRLHS